MTRAQASCAGLTINDGCRIIPSFVTSEYVISASKRVSTQIVSRFFTGTVSGDIGRATGSSAHRIAAAVLWSHPVPTRPT